MLALHYSALYLFGKARVSYSVREIFGSGIPTEKILDYSIAFVGLDSVKVIAEGEDITVLGQVLIKLRIEKP